MKRVMLPVALVLSVLCNACAINAQKNGIRDARIGLAIAGEALKIADQAAAEHFEQFPADDTEMYCKGEIVTLALEEVQSALLAAADSVKLWETALAVYLQKKEAGDEQGFDWSQVLNSEAAWFKIAVDAISALDVVMRELEHAGVKIPAAVKYAWSFLYAMTGNPQREPYEMDWSKLKGGVCEQWVTP